MEERHIYTLVLSSTETEIIFSSIMAYYLHVGTLVRRLISPSKAAWQTEHIVIISELEHSTLLAALSYMREEIMRIYEGSSYGQSMLADLNRLRERIEKREQKR